MSRNLQDANLSVTTALPAAAASNTSAAIDLRQISADVINEQFDVKITVPALPALVDAKTVTLKLQDSADGLTFADIPELASLVLTGATGGGVASETTRTVRLPNTTRRYIALNQAVLTAGGDNTGVSTTLQLLF